MVVETKSVEETREIGRRVGAVARAGTVLALVGELGAGKTQFVKGLALGVGVSDPNLITSPTFVLMNTYEGRVPIRHYDLYRIQGAELGSLGFYDFRESSVQVLEWGEKAGDLGDHLRVTFEITGESSRCLHLQPAGPSSEELLRTLNLSS